MCFCPQDTTYCELFLSINKSHNISHIKGLTPDSDTDQTTCKG